MLCCFSVFKRNEVEIQRAFGLPRRNMEGGRESAREGVWRWKVEGGKGRRSGRSAIVLVCIICLRASYYKKPPEVRRRIEAKTCYTTLSTSAIPNTTHTRAPRCQSFFIQRAYSCHTIITRILVGCALTTAVHELARMDSHSKHDSRGQRKRSDNGIKQIV